MALARRLGADHTLEVEREDAEALVRDLSFEGLGADGVYECSGAGPAAQNLLKLVRRQGRYVQIGLFGKPVAWDLDQVCYKELVVTGSNASVPAAWLRALELLKSGAVDTAALVTDTFPRHRLAKSVHTLRTQRGCQAPPDAGGLTWFLPEKSRW